MITLSQESATTSPRRGGSGGAVAEQYYALASWLRPSHDPVTGGVLAAQPRTIGITSCVRGAGVSTVAANLAVAAAQSNEASVLLVDLSGHGGGGRKAKSSQYELALRLGCSEQDLAAQPLGVAAALESGNEFNSGSEFNSGNSGKAPRGTVATGIPGLSLLIGSPAPLSVLESGRLIELLHELERHFGFIVVDLPPTDSGLCFSIAGTLDGVLLVMDGQRTHSGAAARAKHRLIHANAAVLGIILNHHTRDLPRWLDGRL